MLACLLTFVLGAQAAKSPVVSNLLVVSASELPNDKRVEVFGLEKVEDCQTRLGKKRFKLFKGDVCTFLIEERALGTEGLEEQRRMLGAMADALQKGDKVISVDKLSPEDAAAVRSVMHRHLDQIDPGLRSVIDSPKFKFALEPVVTATFEGQGMRKRASAYPTHDSDSLLTPDDTSSNGKQATPPTVEPRVENSFRFYYSNDFTRPSQRLKAMKEFDKIAAQVLESDISAYEAAYNKLRDKLFAAYGDQMGDSAPPKASDFSKLPKGLQDTLSRTFSAAYQSMGFDSRSGADSWLRNSNMVSSNPYINIVFGGTDSAHHSPLIGSIVFNRP